MSGFRRGNFEWVIARARAADAHGHRRKSAKLCSSSWCSVLRNKLYISDLSIYLPACLHSSHKAALAEEQSDSSIERKNTHLPAMADADEKARAEKLAAAKKRVRLAAALPPAPASCLTAMASTDMSLRS